MAYCRQERTLGGVGFFGGRAGQACIFKEFCVMEGHANRGGNGGEQPLIGFGEAAFLIGGLNADDADDLAAGRNRHAKVRSGIAAHLFNAQPGAVTVHVFIDEQRLAGADDLRSEPGAERARPGFLAEGVRKLKHHGGAIEQRNVGNGRVKQVADLIANKLDQAVAIELRGQRLA